MRGLSAAVSHSGKQTGDSRTALCSLCSALVSFLVPGVTLDKIGIEFSPPGSPRWSLGCFIIYHIFLWWFSSFGKGKPDMCSLSHLGPGALCAPEPSGGCPHYPVALPVPLPIRAEKGYTEGSPYSAFLIPYFTVQNTLFLKESLYKGE